jgi:hypothetical protein
LAGTHLLEFIKGNKGKGSDNLTTTLVDSTAIYGELSKGDLALRLLCFATDGVIVFQGLKIRVTM